MDDVAAVFEALPEEYVLADREDLAGTVTTRADDPGPLDRARTLLTEAATIEVLTPVVPDVVVEELTDQVLDGETAIEVVATGEAAAVLTQGPLAAAQPMLMGRSDVSLHQHDGDAPIAVLLREDRVAIAAIEAGTITVVFESEGEAARSWARDVYEVYEAEATQLV